jgi:pSer/pThr/pTyr-binding forkhead associated (FHA) protein
MKMFLQTCCPLTRAREIVVGRFPFVIGRRSDADGCLTLPYVSRRHCRFTRTGNQLWVQDLESYNGTYVIGLKASTPLPVHDGDVVTLGLCSFRVSVLHSTGERPALARG